MLVTVLSYSLAFVNVATAILCILQFRTASASFHPFLCLMVSDALFMLVGVNFNLDIDGLPEGFGYYVSVAFLLLCWQAVKWRLGQNIVKVIWVIVIPIVVLGLLLSSIHSPVISRWFNFVTDTLVIIFAMVSLIKSINNVDSVTIRKPIFYIAIGLLTQYLFSIIAPAFFIINGHLDETVLSQLMLPYSIVNLIAYFFFIRAILCIPHQSISFLHS